MQGQRIGYIRVSTIDQHEERQLEGIPLDKQGFTVKEKTVHLICNIPLHRARK